MKNEFTLVGGGSNDAPAQELDIIISQGGCTIDPAY